MLGYIMFTFDIDKNRKAAKIGVPDEWVTMNNSYGQECWDTQIILPWLMEYFEQETYVIWHFSDERKAYFVSFANVEDAMAFKLRFS